MINIHIQVCKMKEVPYESLNKDQRILLQYAENAQQNSYNPYSHFYVGAAILSSSGQIITGANIENAAYGSTICAERAAISSANSRGIRDFSMLAIIAQGEKFDTTEVAAPCGACRQVLFEFSQISGINLEVILSTSKKDKIVLTSINELLPLGFGPLDLGINVRRYRRE